MTPEDHKTLYVALFLIVLALVSIAIGERLHYAQLVGFALTVGGGGLGILTNKYVQQVTTQGGGPINNPPGGSK